MKLDATDQGILRLLQKDARMTIKEIAAILQLSSTPIFERIKKLERAGVIEKYVALVNAEMLGKRLNAFVNLSIKDHSKEAVNTFVAAIEAFPEVMECHYVSGNYDFLLKVLVKDMNDYYHFLKDKLSVVPNIARTETLFTLSVSKKTTAVEV